MSDQQQAVDGFRKLMATAEAPLLGPGRREGTTEVAELNRTLESFFSEHRIAAPLHPLLCSAAFLWHDHLAESHTISQNIETRDGSWLHGIMHRREPDYGNARYWFRRVGQHDAFPELAARVAKFLHNDSGELTERLIENGEWMPLAFIDECERVESHGSDGGRKTLRAIQAIEFDVLVEHILRLR